MSKKLVVKYARTKQAVTRALYQYDYGQKLVFDGPEFPDICEVHFSNVGDSVTSVVFGDRNGVKIPDKFLQTGKDINAWLFAHTRSCDGESVFKVLIPVMKRGAIEEQDTSTPIEYIFDGGDSETEDTTQCHINEYIFDGGDSEHNI